MVSNDYVFRNTPGKALLKLSYPILIGMIAMTLFNVADTWYVARLGTLELAAITFTFPVIMLLNGVTLGLGVGLTAVISTKVGEGAKDEVKKYTRDGLVLALIIVFAIMLAGLLTIEPLFKMLGASDEILPLIADYMTVWYWGAFTVVVPMVGNAAIRGTGDSVTPAWIMSSAAILNIILDPFIIYGIGPFPRMEMQGAAIATVISRTVTMMAALYILCYRDKLIEFKIPHISKLFKRLKDVLEVGVFTAMIHILIPIASGVVTRIIAANGPIDIAAFGAGSRIEMFAGMVPIAFSSGMIVYAGQHWGAKSYNRMREGIKKGIQYVLITGSLIYAIVLLAANPISVFFTKDPAVQELLVVFLRVVLAGIMIEAVSSIAGSVHNGIRRPKVAFMVYSVRFILLIVPAVYLGNLFGGITGIFYGLLISKILSGIFGWLVLKRLCREMGQPI